MSLRRRHSDTPATRMKRTPRRRGAGPDRDRRTYRPGLGAFAMEVLEPRRLLDGDLTQQIITLIQDKATGSFTYADVTVGSFLDVPSVTVSLSGITQPDSGDWTGTVSISALSASLGFGNALTASISGTMSGAAGLSGSYTLKDQPAGSGTYALTAGSITATIPGALDLSASGLAINYGPTEAAGSTIATLNSASGTLIPLNNATLTLSGLAIQDNGFKLASTGVSLGPINLGGVVEVDKSTATLSGVSYTTASSLTAGTIGVSAASASLFPGNARLSASLAGFSDIYTLGTGASTISATSGEVAAGSIFDAKASKIGLAWDGTNAGVSLMGASLTSPLLPGASGTLNDLTANNTGFSLGSADVTAQAVTIGGVLDIGGLDLGVTNLDYTAANNSLTGTFSIGTGTVSILPNAAILNTSLTNFSASYDLAGNSLSAKADGATIKGGSAIEVDATGLGFTFVPVAGDDLVTVSIGAATATMPNEGITGSISGLAITNDGFSLAGATLAHSGATSAFGGKFSIVNPSVALTNFGYSTAAGGFTNGSAGATSSTLTLAADAITFAPAASVGATATGLTATIDFTPTHLGHFTFTAGDVTASLGSFLSLDAKGVSFDSAPTGNAPMASFNSLTAAVNIGTTFSVTGTATGLAIDADGGFAQQAGQTVGVSLNLSDTSEVQWPSWLPISVKNFDVEWTNFNEDPTDFTLELTAGVNANIGSSGVEVTGEIDDVVIDTGLLQQGKFPITSLSDASIGIKGTLFGTTVTGSIFFGILDVDTSGNQITNTTTAVASRIFYGGIEGGLTLDNATGFEVRLGVSSLGPLSAFVDVEAPILLDPDSGLAVTDFYAGIDFDSSLPAVTDPHALTTNPAFTPPTEQPLKDWKDALGDQVAAQAKNVASGLNALSGPVKISAGTTFFDEYATTNAFELTGNVVFDTTGKFDVSGTLTVGNSVSLNASLYADMSSIQSSGKATLLMASSAPAQAPVLTTYGSLQVQTGGDLNLDGKTAYGSATIAPLGSGPFSVEFWSRRDDNDEAETVVNTTGLTMGYDSGNHFVVQYGSMKVASPKATDLNWHHWAATFDGTNLSLYEDGAFVKQLRVPSSPLTSSTLLVGKSGTTYFTGSVEAVRVWNVARSGDDISANYKLAVPATKTGLIGSWAFYTGPEQVAPDRSGMGHPMVLIGTTDFSKVASYPSPLNASFTVEGQTFTTYAGFGLIIGGEADLAVPSLPGGLDVTGSANIQVDLAATGIDLNVTGSATIQPLGLIGSLAGSAHFDLNGTTPELYGALLVGGDLSTIPQFTAAGLTANATGFLRFNTTNVAQEVALQLPSTPGATPLAAQLESLPADSFSLYMTGDLGKAGVFDVSGSLYVGFSYAKLANGSTDPSWTWPLQTP